MLQRRCSRPLSAALVIVTFLVPSCIALAQGSAHRPTCAPEYSATRVRGRTRAHAKLVRTREWRCAATVKTHVALKNCAGEPGSAKPDYASLDACGYPSPRTTGVPPGLRLKPSGSIVARTAGQVITRLAVDGTIDVAADNVTIKDTSVSYSSSCCWAIRIAPGVSGTVLKYDTIHGSNSRAGSLAWAVYNTGSAASVVEDHVYTYDADRILDGPGTVANSYCLANANIPGEHYECVYAGQGSVTINHDTLLNPHAQTGADWVGEDFGNIGRYTVENSLLAGGGYTLYGAAPQPGARGVLVGPVTIVNNRFSRLYFPRGGYWGTHAWFATAQTLWSGNVWDNTDKVVSP